MEKIVKKYGDAWVITFDPEDRKINEIEEGDILELTITKIHKNKKEDTKKEN